MTARPTNLPTPLRVTGHCPEGAPCDACSGAGLRQAEHSTLGYAPPPESWGLRKQNHMLERLFQYSTAYSGSSCFFMLSDMHTLVHGYFFGVVFLSHNWERI